MYNPMTYETADVISTYVFRQGILQANFSFSTAVGLFNSVINFSLLVVANSISRRANETSLW
jgi:putative aldouronate transport system permease protein